MEAPTIQLSNLSISDLQDIQVDQSPYKYEILLTVAEIFGIGDRLSDIEKFLHDSQTLQKLEDFSYDFLTPSAKAKLDSLFDKQSQERINYLNASKKGLLGIYNWLDGLYQTKKKRDKHNYGHSKSCFPPKDASMNDITADDSLPTAALEERMISKANFENAKNTLKMIESEIENELIVEFDNDNERFSKLATVLIILFDLEEDIELAKKLISNNKDFVQKARKLRRSIVPKEKIDSVRVILLDPDLRLSQVNELSPGLGNLMLWVNSFVNYWVMLQFLETGEMALSEKAEKDARRQESMIIRTHSCLLDEFENKPDSNYYTRDLKNPSIEDLL
jgi:hypothetical protein